MNVAAVAILVLGLANLSVSALAVKDVVDWDAVMVEVTEIEILLETTVTEIKKLVSDTNEEVGQEIAGILDPALQQEKDVLLEVKNEVLQMTLTAGQARAYFMQIDILIEQAERDMEAPLSQLHPTLVKEIEDNYDDMQIEIGQTEEYIYYLLSVDA